MSVREGGIDECYEGGIDEIIIVASFGLGVCEKREQMIEMLNESIQL